MSRRKAKTITKIYTVIISFAILEQNHDTAENNLSSREPSSSNWQRKQRENWKKKKKKSETREDSSDRTTSLSANHSTISFPVLVSPVNITKTHSRQSNGHDELVESDGIVAGSVAELSPVQNRPSNPAQMFHSVHLFDRFAGHGDEHGDGGAAVTESFHEESSKQMDVDGTGWVDEVQVYGGISITFHPLCLPPSDHECRWSTLDIERRIRKFLLDRIIDRALRVNIDLWWSMEARVELSIWTEWSAF